MATLHDNLAGICCMQILKDLGPSGKGDFQQIFSKNIRRIGTSGWPLADFQLLDYDNNYTWAFEFKPPGQQKREYVTGLGQAYTYLNFADYSALIVPVMSNDRFSIADYLSKTSKLEVLSNSPVAIFAYDESRLLSGDPGSLSLIRSINNKRSEIPPNKKSEDSGGVFWTWWRDTSDTELYRLLELSDIHRGKSPDIYTDYVWPDFQKELANGKVCTWEGEPRRVNSGFSQHKQNYKIPLFRLGLIEQDSGDLTEEGYDLLKIGKIFKPNSAVFLDEIARIILTRGQHLELINQLENYQNSLARNAEELQSSKSFFGGFETWLDKQGLIPQRKPGRVTTGNKNSFIRDEPKLWNKLHLTNVKNDQYFERGYGIKFNISRITSLIRE